MLEHHPAPSFGARLEHVLGAAETPASTHHLMTALVNDLHDGPGLRLVLDDSHEIADADAAGLVDALADHLPEDRLVVASRTEPSLSLPRRRVRGELAEFGLDDLRLDPASIRTVLGHRGDADEAAVEALAQISGGWAAAVRLAAAGAAPGLAEAQESGLDPVGSMQAELWGFLAEEVLDAQPADLRMRSILDEGVPMVMGWHISVHRQINDRAIPSADSDPRGARLATWQARVNGLDWLMDLVETDDAVHLSTNGGYPIRYTVRAGAAIPIILNGPPHARTTWIAGPTHIVDFDRWPGRTTTDQRAIEQCQPDEWLEVEAWDES